MRKRKSPKTLDITRVFGHGAGGGTRTHTLSPAKDFESSSSANSNTPARLFLKSLLKITNRKLEGYAGGMLRRNTVFSFQKFPVYQGLSYPACETAKSILSPPRLPIPSLRLIPCNTLTQIDSICKHSSVSFSVDDRQTEHIAHLIEAVMLAPAVARCIPCTVIEGAVLQRFRRSLLLSLGKRIARSPEPLELRIRKQR